MSPRRPTNFDGPLDRLIHEASRLMIVAVLNECEAAGLSPATSPLS
jgi:hypothetical protein